jgi:hypothetical protein
MQGLLGKEDFSRNIVKLVSLKNWKREFFKATK